MSWRMKLAPIAVINGASLGAWRSGRYATRSIVALMRPHEAITSTSVAMLPATDTAR